VKDGSGVAEPASACCCVGERLPGLSTSVHPPAPQVPPAAVQAGVQTGVERASAPASPAACWLLSLPVLPDDGPTCVVWVDVAVPVDPCEGVCDEVAVALPVWPAVVVWLSDPWPRRHSGGPWRPGLRPTLPE
jgi:hypothetical protein